MSGLVYQSTDSLPIGGALLLLRDVHCKAKQTKSSISLSISFSRTLNPFTSKVKNIFCNNKQHFVLGNRNLGASLADGQKGRPPEICWIGEARQCLGRRKENGRKQMSSIHKTVNSDRKREFTRRAAVMAATSRHT